MHVARVATYAGSAGSIVLSLSRVLFGVLDWRFGGNTGTPWFGMKPSSAHAGLDGIDRSHPPGGCNRRRSSKDIDFLLPTSADVPGATLTGNATVFASHAAPSSAGMVELECKMKVGALGGHHGRGTLSR